MGRNLLFLILSLLGMTALARAQEPARPEAEPVTVPRDAAGPRIFGPLQEVWVPVEAEVVAPPSWESLAPLTHASDTCSDATPLELIDGTAGDLATVNDMTSSPTDPVLSCVWGQPQDPRGYRTVWYKFKAKYSGRLIITTSVNPSDYRDSYDTVLSLYRATGDSCTNLEQVACNDDYRGFVSQITTFVIQGQTYYLEVADWQFAVEQAATLRLAIVLEEGSSFWTPAATAERMPFPVSRHMVVNDGTYFYVIAGEVAITPFPDRDGKVMRFDPETKTWLELYPMPSSSDNLGYSRTSGVYLDGRIYTPSGYVGNNEAYDGTHWVFEIATNSWFTTTPVPWATASPSGKPYAWAQAVALPPNGYYLTGGLLSGDPDPSFPSNAQPTSRLLFFSPAADGRSGTWRTDLPDMSRARYAHVAALLNTPQGRKVCVASGLSKATADQAQVLRGAECYGVASGTWEPIASLNFARFGAGSAVGPDGRWYVFGGADANLEPVTVTEVYNPDTGTWQILDSRFDLRDPGRLWPRGGFIGDSLWIFGGETTPGQLVVPLVQQLYAPAPQALLPVIFGPRIGQTFEPNDTFAQAIALPLNQTQTGDFAMQEDFFDVYRFEAPSAGVYEVVVGSVPPDHNYDVYIYSANKFPVGFGTTVGNLDEHAFTLPLEPGVYYAMVLRAFGAATSDPYSILVRKAQ